MSPRRNSQDLERIGVKARESLKEYVSTFLFTFAQREFPVKSVMLIDNYSQARTLQSSLAALAERIDEVKSDHDKLESENRFLQDYIGGLTRTMSQRDMGSSLSGRNKSKGGRSKR